MLEELEIGDVVPVAPEKLNRRQEELPGKIRDAFDLTPIGEARTLQVKVGITADRLKIGSTLLRLLKAHAKSKGFVAFKATATPNDEGLALYWQKKPARQLKPAVEPAIEPMPSEPITSKPKGRRISPATDELRDE